MPLATWHDDGMRRRWIGAAGAVARDTARRAQGHDLALLAAGLAFYAGIAIIPLLLFGLYGAGLVIGEDQVMSRVDRLADFAPATLGVPALVRALGEMGPRLGIPSLIASVITATTYGEGMLRAVDALEDRRRGNRTLAGRIRVLPYVGVFPLVTVAGLLTVAALPDVLGGGRSGQVLGVYLTFWVGWLSATALLIVLYRLFATRPLHWTATVLGSLATGSFLAGMSLGWVLVLRYGIAVGQAFGGSAELGRTVLFAVYLLLVQTVVLIGHLLVQSIDAHLTAPTLTPRDHPSPPATTPNNHPHHSR